MFEMTSMEKMILAFAVAELKGERREAATLCVSVALGEDHPSALVEVINNFFRLVKNPDGMEAGSNPLLKEYLDETSGKLSLPDLSIADQCRYVLVSLACMLSLGFLGAAEPTSEESINSMLMALYKAGFILMLEEHEKNKEKTND